VKLHERHDSTVKAHLAIAEAVVGAVKQYDLTFAELMSILAAEIASWAKYSIRDERET
jgi:hypothetical protein